MTTALLVSMFFCLSAYSDSEFREDGYRIDYFDILAWNGLISEPSTSNPGSAKVYYNRTDDKLYLSKNTGAYAELGAGGGATAYDDIADPDAAGSISFGDNETATYSSAEDTGTFFNISLTDNNLAGETEALRLSLADNDDANGIFLSCYDDSGGDNDLVFKIGNGGKLWIGDIADNYTLPTADGTAGYVLATNGVGAVDFTDPNTLVTAYTGGDFLTLTAYDFDVDTAAVTNGDTTHLSTADAIYDFVTGLGYLVAADIDTSAEIFTITGDETGSGNLVGSTNPTFDFGILVEDPAGAPPRYGVWLNNTGQNTLVMAGDEAGSEDLYFALTAGNTITLSSSTGANLLDYGLIGVNLEDATLEVPNSATAAPAVTGQVVLDTTDALWADGQLIALGAANKLYVVSTMDEPSDNQIIQYDAALDGWYCEDAAAGGGETLAQTLALGADANNVATTSWGDMSMSGLFTNTMAADDSIGIVFEGTANDFTGAGPNTVIDIDRDYNVGNGNTVGSYYGILNYLYPKHAAWSAVTDNIYTYASVNMVRNTGYYKNSTASTYKLTERGGQSYVDDNGYYDSASTGAMSAEIIGHRTLVESNPTFTDSGATTPANGLTVIGEKIYVIDQPTLTSGTLARQTNGVYIECNGSTVGSSITRGIAIMDVGGGDYLYGIADYSGDTWYMASDNQRLEFGAGSTFAGDAYITFDGDSLNIVSDSITATDDILLNECTVDQDGGITGVATNDFGGATSFEIPNSATPTVNATGEVAWDSTETLYAQGMLTAFGASALVYMVGVLDEPADNDIISYDDATKTWVCEAPGAAGATAYDDIGDPDAATTIAFDDTEIVTYSNASDGEVFFKIDNTDADLAGATTLLELEYTDDGDADGTFAEFKDNNGDSKFKVGAEGDTTIAGDLNRPISYINGMIVQYEGATNIYITQGECVALGKYYEQVTKEEVATGVTAGTDFYYVYIDDSASAEPDITWVISNTEPAYNGTAPYYGWYNGDDRCIGVVWTTGASTVGQFSDVGASGYIYGTSSSAINIYQFATNANPSGSWTSVETTIYTPVNAIGVFSVVSGGDADNATYAGCAAGDNLTDLIISYSYITSTAAGWLYFKRVTDSRDLQYLGQNDDDNVFNGYIRGYIIER